MSALQDMLAPLPDITPEKLTILKLKHSTLNRDVFSEPSSPIQDHRVMDFPSHSNNVSSVITRRSSSRAASGTRRRSIFTRTGPKCRENLHLKYVALETLFNVILTVTFRLRANSSP